MREVKYNRVRVIGFNWYEGLEESKWFDCDGSYILGIGWFGKGYEENL